MSRSFSVGSYTRNIEREDDPFTSRVMAIKNDDASALSEEEKLTADQIKAAERLAQRNDQKQQDLISNREMADVFLVEHPEYIDSTPNGELMNHELTRMFGDRAYSLVQYEQAYQSLRASNFLALNKTKVAEQAKAAAKQRAEAERAQSVEPSLDELYQMPLEDLRRLDAVENQKRMQRRGEEGGF